MKKPYFNEFEREMIRAKTLQGDSYMLRLAIKKLQREVIIIFKNENSNPI